jgi:hypothetical protein
MISPFGPEACPFSPEHDERRGIQMTEFNDETDRRLHPRVEIPGLARAMTEEGVIEGTVSDISAGGAALLAERLLQEGEQLSLEIEGLSPLGGEVTRTFDEGFVVSFELSSDEQDRFLAEIMQIQNDIDAEDF